MKGVGAFSAYGRGVSSVFQGVRELRISFLRQLFVTLLICGVGAVWYIYQGLSPAARAALPSYMRMTVGEAVGWGKLAGAGSASLAELYDGRSCQFMGWQWVFYTLATTAVVTGFVTVVMVARGREAVGDKHRRGTTMVDTTTWEYQHRAQMDMVWMVLGCGCLGGLLAAGYVVTLAGLWAVPDVVVAWLAVHSTTVAGLPWLSPGGTGALIWTPAPISKLLLPTLSLKRSLEQLGETGVIGLLAAGMFGEVFGGYAGGLWSQRALRRALKKGDVLIRIGGVEVERKREVLHFLVSGATGTGKSVALTQILRVVRLRGQRAIVFDPSGEFIKKFYRKGKDIILNPSDKRSAVWSPWAEMRAPGDEEMIAGRLFPKAAGGGKDDFWMDSAAGVFAGILQRLTRWDARRNSHLAYLVQILDSKVLADLLDGTVGGRFIDKSSRETSTNVLMSAAAKLKWSRYLRDLRPGEKPFSVRDYVQDEAKDSWLFISMRDEDAEKMQRLVSLWLDLAIGAVLSLPGESENKPVENRRRLFVSLDELQALQMLPSLKPALNQGRKYGLSVILGIQSVMGVRQIYGNTGGDALIGQLQNLLVLRTPDFDTAKYMSGQLGMEETERKGESVQLGAGEKNAGAVSVSNSVAQEAVVMAAEIQELPDLVGYLKMVEKPLMKVRYVPGDPKPNPLIERFVAAEPVPEPEPPPALAAWVLMHEVEKAKLAGSWDQARELVGKMEKELGGKGGEMQKQVANLKDEVKDEIDVGRRY